MKKLLSQVFNPRHPLFWRIAFILFMVFGTIACIFGMWSYIQNNNSMRRVERSYEDMTRRIGARLDRQAEELSTIRVKIENSNRDREELRRTQEQLRKNQEKLREKVKIQ